MAQLIGRRGNYNFDFIIALAFFLGFYATIFTILPYYEVQPTIIEDPLKEESAYLEHVLIRTPGYPSNWTTLSEVQRIGLAVENETIEYGILDSNKVLAINAQDCSALQHLSGITTNFKIRIETGSTSYECNTSISGAARYLEKPVSIREDNATAMTVAYETGKIRIWIW
ncbi:MAG: hypothetical protein J4432_04020 [DPANN group archaeon]|nr:hypothetical protein [DPANN group archaeon]